MARRRWGFLGQDDFEDAAPAVDLADVDGAFAAEAAHQVVGQLPLAAGWWIRAAASAPDHLVPSSAGPGDPPAAAARNARRKL